MLDDTATIPEIDPPGGGRWLRDPLTGALTPAPAEPQPQPVPDPTEKE